MLLFCKNILKIFKNSIDEQKNVCYDNIKLKESKQKGEQVMMESRNNYIDMFCL